MADDMHYDKRTVLKGYYIVYFKQGKLINDIRKIPAVLKKYFAETFQHSRSLQSFSVSTYKLYQELLNRQTIGVLLKAFITALVLLKKYFIVILINFTGSLIVAFLARYFLAVSLSSFFVAVIPIILLFTISWELYFSYLWINEKEKIVPFSKISSLAVQRLVSICSLSLFQFALVIETIVLYFAVTLGITYLFGMAGIDWGTSFLFWWFAIVLGLITGLLLSYFILLFPQSYFLVLFQKRTPLQAILEAKQLISQRFSAYILGYVSVGIMTTLITVLLSLRWADVGVIVSLDLLFQSIIFFGFLLWQKLAADEIEIAPTTPGMVSKFFLFLVVLAAIPSYLSLTSTSLRIYPKVASIINHTEETIPTEPMTMYDDKTFLYTINYPQSWDVYHEQDNGVTFYHNYTKTDDGGLWIRVVVSPALQEDFDKIYYSKPGIIDANGAKTITAKITNTTINNSRAAEYSETMQTASGQQFVKHYIIFRNRNIYDVSLTTTSKNTENFYGNTFEQMVATFQFTDLPTSPTP